MNHSYPTHRAPQAAVVFLTIALLLLLAVSGLIAADGPAATAAVKINAAVGSATTQPTAGGLHLAQ